MMDKNKNNKKSYILKSLNNTSGYSIEFGDASYENTLEERIQAARLASLTVKQEKQQNSKEKILTNSRNAILKNDTDFNNKTVKKTTNIVNEFKIKNEHFKQTINDYSPNSILTRDRNSNLQDINNTSDFLKPVFKGGSSMQQRLESIKCNKKLFNNSSCEFDKTKDAIKLTKNVNFQHSLSKNNNSKHTSTNFTQHYEYKTKSTIQNKCNESSTLCGHCNRTKNSTTSSSNLVSSVQNRLIKAREEIKTKSKLLNQNTLKIEIITPHASDSNYQNSNSSLSQNNKKTIRLNQSGLITKKKIPPIASITKKLISNNSDVSKLIPNNLVTIKQSPMVPVPAKSSETSISTNLQNQNTWTISKQKELDSFSFVIKPEKWSVQQRLENKKKVQFIDDSMEMEVESENIVNKVNDLRKSKHEYEPMEWTPESIMYCDQINLCLVIDTNIFLSDLKLIAMIIDTFIPEYGYPTIVLPWQVLQELDCLKTSENVLGYRAREATRWLFGILSSHHPRLKGQPMTVNPSINFDDAILHCAIIVKTRVNFVYLITNDKILSIKSEINDIPSKSSIWLQDKVQNVQSQNNHNIFQDAVSKYPTIETNLIMKFEPHLEHIIAQILKFAVGQHKNVPAFSTKTWWKIYSLTQPFNLIKCLLKLKEHWNIIAPHQLFKTPQKEIEWLVWFFKNLQTTSADTTLTWNDLYIFLKYCSEIINELPYEYYNITDMILYDLMKARKMLKQKIDHSNTTLDDNITNALSNNLRLSNNNNSNVDNILLNIIKKVETFCSNVYKANRLSRNSFKDELHYLSFKNMYSRNNVEKFCHILSNLIKVMYKIKKMRTEEVLKSHIIINAFLKAIIEFDNDLKKLNTERLIDYCLMKDKNSFFNILVSLQNYLSAIKNLVTTCNS